ncbi:MAG: hypothetical protein J5586_04270 [Clostridia bacterium]|nr:hypothetical protein [Clostridia bacterium]
MKKTRKRILTFLLSVLAVVTVVFLIYLWQEQYRTGRGKPTIICPTESIYVSVENLSDPGVLLRDVTAMDAEDGDITSSLVVESVSQFVEKDHCIVTYAAFDSANNVSKLTRHLFLTDYSSPRFRLIGPLEFNHSSSFDPLSSVRAYDCVDGDISDRVKMILKDPNDDVYSVGVHPVEFRVANSLGDVSVLEAEIDVYERTYTESRMIPAVRLTDYLVYADMYGYVDPMSLVSGVYLGGVLYDISEYKGGALTVDASEVDYKTPGVYRIVYTCENRAEYYGSTVLIVIVTEVDR